MAKTQFTKNLDAVQREVRPFLKEHGFNVKGRAFNRETEEGLVQVIHFYLDSGSFAFGVIHESAESPPGQFWVEIGVYIPEVAKSEGNEEAGWKKTYNCAIRRRMMGPDGDNIYATFWNCLPADVIGRALITRIKSDAFPFFERYATRAAIISKCGTGETWLPSEGWGLGEITAAIILAGQGDASGAENRLRRDYARTDAQKWPGRAKRLLEIAHKLGLDGFTLPDK